MHINQKKSLSYNRAVRSKRELAEPVAAGRAAGGTRVLPPSLPPAGARALSPAAPRSSARHRRGLEVAPGRLQCGNAVVGEGSAGPGRASRKGSRSGRGRARSGSERGSACRPGLPEPLSTGGGSEKPALPFPWGMEMPSNVAVSHLLAWVFQLGVGWFSCARGTHGRKLS